MTIKDGDVVEYQESKWTVVGFADVFVKKELLLQQFYQINGCWLARVRAVPKQFVRKIHEHGKTT